MSEELTLIAVFGIFASSSGVNVCPIHVAPAIGYQPFLIFQVQLLFGHQLILAL